MRLITSTLLALGLATSAQATTITADIVLEYFEPTLDQLPTNGVFDGRPNGRPSGSILYDAIDLKVGWAGQNTPVTDGNSATYLSLPKDSFVVLGFSTGFIFDGTGDDLFVDELGNGGEDADVFVSFDFGSTFTFLDTALGNRTNRFDFADYVSAIGTDVKVNAVKLVGLDNGGSAPGFDVTFVQGLEGSVTEEPQGPLNPIPLPAGLPLILLGLGSFGMMKRMKK